MKMSITTALRALVSLAAALVLHAFVPNAVPTLSAQCTLLIGCEGGGGGGVGVAIDPESGAWTGSAASMQVVVTIGWCSESGGFNGNRSVLLDGANVTAAFGWAGGTMDGCNTYMTSTGTITLSPGAHTLTARITDTSLRTGEATASYTYTQVTTPPPPAGTPAVQVTPDAEPVTRGAAQRATERFTVANPGTGAGTFSLAATCVGSGVASCGASIASLTIPAGGAVSVGVNYATAGAGTSGSVRLTAWKSGDSAAVNDAGSREVAVAAVPAPGAAGDPGETTAVDRSACLMLPAGLEATYECGDLRLAHSLPATRVLNRSFAPTLLYNSQHAFPYPIVGATVHSPGPTLPSTVVATLTVAGQAPRTATFDGWINGWNRLAVGFDASGLPTGFYDYTFQVKAHFSSGAVTTLYDGAGTLPVVNRSQSRFGRGWWLAGMEELRVAGKPAGSLMWIGGDGSTLRYGPVAANRWAAERFAGTDTIVRLADKSYRRLLPGGDTVAYDSLGRHVRTANRRGHRTEFEWTGGVLTRVYLPRTQAFNTGMSYLFEYGNAYGMLSRVTAPSGGAARAVSFENADGRVLAVGGPDTTWVRFAYFDATARIAGRRDRRGTWSYVGYDAGSKLAIARVVTGAGPNDYVAVYFTAQESRGIAATPGNLIYTVFNGPRPDAEVADYTYVWVNRRGEPVQVTDALGSVTNIYREDPGWPGATTRVRYQNGREVTSSYDGLGRLSSTTDWGSGTGGRFATTLYEWDDRCASVKRTTLPEGEVTSSGYTADCLTEWVQPGHDARRRTTFAYDSASSTRSPRLATAVLAPDQGGSPQRFAYDARGNLERVTTPLGNWSEYLNDATGRVLRARVPVDSAGSAFQQDSTVFDVMDRPTLTIASGPAGSYVKKTTPANTFTMPAESLWVRTVYDPEGLATRITRWGKPSVSDSLVIHREYDQLRRMTTERSPDNQVESHAYDAAGNDTLYATRLGDLIRMRYDALGRMTSRVVPGKTFAAQSFAAGPDVWWFPYFRPDAAGALELLNGGTSGLTLPRDSAAFTYDAMGNMRSAVNVDARIRRGYALNGALVADTLEVRNYTGAPCNTVAGVCGHQYVVTHGYDLNGRVSATLHPVQLAQTPAIQTPTETYRYDEVGELGRITDILGNHFYFTHTASGQLDSLAMPGSIGVKWSYDGDGRVRSRVERSALGLSPGGDPLHDDHFEYDRRGKALRTLTRKGEIVNTYTGLGMLARTYASEGYVKEEQYLNDAFGNRTRSFRHYKPAGNPKIERDSTGYSYELATARLLATRPNPDIGAVLDSAAFDAAGNKTYSRTTNAAGRFEERARYYYAADGSLRVVDRRTCNLQSTVNACNPQSTPSYGSRSTFEEFRYDPLGRRILSRTRQEFACTSLTCDRSIRRFVWNGDQLLYEIRYPGKTGTPAATLERDTGVVIETGTVAGSTHRVPPYYGRVGYTHGPQIDAPLGLVRFDYSDTIPAPVAVFLHSNWRGQYDGGSFDDGKFSRCTTPNQYAFYSCVRMEWPASDESIYFTRGAAPEAPNVWIGGLVDGMRDASGQMYMRNRYYDPQVGRFTQEDPIGIAGGLNVYGYANGDPVSYSDPYGLEACCRSFAEWWKEFKEWTKTIRPEGGHEPAPGIKEFQAWVRNALANPCPPQYTCAAVPLGIGGGASRLSAGAQVCRGGTCEAGRFIAGAEGADAAGRLSGVSVTASNTASVRQLSSGFGNNRVGVTTVGRIRAAGGEVVPDAVVKPGNPFHARINGLTGHQLEELFTPTIRNPSKP